MFHSGPLSQISHSPRRADGPRHGGQICNGAERGKPLAMPCDSARALRTRRMDKQTIEWRGMKQAGTICMPAIHSFFPEALHSPARDTSRLLFRSFHSLLLALFRLYASHRLLTVAHVQCEGRNILKYIEVSVGYGVQGNLGIPDPAGLWS